MALPPVLSDFLEWRWMPSVALTAGSLLFVGFALLLIPRQIDGNGAAVAAGSFDHPSSTMFSSALAQTPSMTARAFDRPRAFLAPSRSTPPIAERAPERPPPMPTPEVTLPPGIVTAPEPPPPPVDPNAPHREN